MKIVNSGKTKFITVKKVIRQCLGSGLLFFLSATLSLTLNSFSHAQDATITNLNDQSCAGTRFGSNLNCTSNDFTTILSFSQPALTAISECTAGEEVFIDLIADVQSNSPTRYDGGFFIGQTGNDPSLNDPSQQCSLGVFPGTPSPFIDLDIDQCGDFQNQAFATLLMRDIKIICSPAAGSNEVIIPYLLVFNNQTGGNTCSPANITANTKSKCGSEANASVAGLTVNGFLELTKQTVPSGQTQVFDFTTSSTPSASINPSPLVLSDGETQKITVPLDNNGGTRQITVTENLESGWQSDVSVNCTNPFGGDASTYVTIDNATRTITANLDSQNYGAVCTITNTKLPTLTVSKVSQGGVGSFDFTGTNGWTTETVTTTDQFSPSTSTTQILNQVSTATSLTELTTPGFYLTDITCSGLGPGGTFTSDLSIGTASLDGAALAPGADIVCTFTNGVPSHAIQKSVDVTSTSENALLSYTIVVENDGFVDLTGTSLVETLLQDTNTLTLSSGPQLISGDTDSDGVLDIDETWEYNATYQMNQSNLDNANNIVNTASFQTDITPQSSASANTVIIAAPLLTVTKSANQTSNVQEGQTVTYTYIVTNDGNQTLTDVKLSDIHDGSGMPPIPNLEQAVLIDNGTTNDSTNSNTGNNAWDILAPGDVLQITADYVVTQSDIDSKQ